MKDLFKNASIVSIFLIYLFINGTLYIIGFWSTFDFDITNYVEILDIPKSFFLPLSLSLGFLLLSFIGNTILNFHDLAEKKAEKEPESQITFWNGFLRPKGPALLVGILVSLFGYHLDKNPELFTFLICLLMFLFFLLEFMRSKHLKILLPNRLIRWLLSWTLFFVPLASVTIAKFQSRLIFRNESYFFVDDIKFKDSTAQKETITKTKLLGKLGGYVILADSSNKNIFTVNLESVEYITYGKHQE